VEGTYHCSNALVAAYLAANDLRVLHASCRQNGLVGLAAVSVCAPPTTQCPVCTQTLNLVHGEDANDTWARHASSGDCDPSKRAATRKHKCPVAGCRERLLLTNKFTCSSCSQVLCLR
jgi:hypothetical protein